MRQMRQIPAVHSGACARVIRPHECTARFAASPGAAARGPVDGRAAAERGARAVRTSRGPRRLPGRSALSDTVALTRRR